MPAEWPEPAPFALDGRPRGWNHYRVSLLCYGIKLRYGPPVDLGYVPGSPAKKALFRNRNGK